MNADNRADEAAILQLHDDFGDAWSRGDTATLASFFTEDGARVGAGGDVQHGRDAIRAAFDGLLHGPLAGATVTMERATVRFLAPDVALCQAPMTIHTPAGGPVLHGYYVDVVKKVGSRWSILETHPKLYPRR